MTYKEFTGSAEAIQASLADMCKFRRRLRRRFCLNMTVLVLTTITLAFTASQLRTDNAAFALFNLILVTINLVSGVVMLKVLTHMWQRHSDMSVLISFAKHALQVHAELVAQIPEGTDPDKMIYEAQEKL